MEASIKIFRQDIRQTNLLLAKRISSGLNQVLRETFPPIYRNTEIDPSKNGVDSNDACSPYKLWGRCSRDGPGTLLPPPEKKSTPLQYASLISILFSLFNREIVIIDITLFMMSMWMIFARFKNEVTRVGFASSVNET